MADKSWMLNPRAIRHANTCIGIIKEQLGLRLKLSQPDFLSRLHQYVDTINDTRLNEAYSSLLSMAGVGNLMTQLQAPAKAVVAQAVGDRPAELSDEQITIDGQQYPRFRNGREIQGVVGGVPRYRK